MLPDWQLQLQRQRMAVSYTHLDVYKRQDLIKRAITDEPPLAQKDGGIIREGYNADVDKYRHSRTDGKKWLAELEAREKERTGIKTLKIKYSRCV